ncbi:MAG: hypothetical protein ACREBR_00305 [bacterium]
MYTLRSYPAMKNTPTAAAEICSDATTVKKDDEDSNNDDAPIPNHEPGPDSPNIADSLTINTTTNNNNNGNNPNDKNYVQQLASASSSSLHPTNKETPLRSSSSPPLVCHRLVHRNLPFFQSKSEIQIQNNHPFTTYARTLFMLWRNDWYHIFLRRPTYISLTLLLTAWTVLLLIFAGVYMGLDASLPSIDCGLGPPYHPIQFGPAFAFSLETCTTVGYTLPNGTNNFFENCPSIHVAIYVQMTFSMLFNALLFTFFFFRLQRCENRAAQVIFSNKAVVRIVQDDVIDYGGAANLGPPNNNNVNQSPPRIVFEVQVYDADSSHPVVEAHVRLYAVLHNYHNTAVDGEQQQPHLRRSPLPMRIVFPNDELGGMLFTSVPTVVAHHIDAYSPLLPPQFLPNNSNNSHSLSKERVISGHGLVLREVDSYTANREGFPCPVCGEAYGTYARLYRHVKYNQLIERKDDIPVVGSHCELFEDKEVEEESRPILSNDACGSDKKQEPSNQRHQYPSRETMTYKDLQSYWEKTQIEIIAVVEGIDPLASGTFQSLHSYQVNEIDFGKSFVNCFWHWDNVVNWDAFHSTQDAAFMSRNSGNDGNERLRDPS